MSATLRLLILAVEDLGRSAAFYDRALGWPRAVEVPVYIEYAGKGCRLGIYQRDAYAVNTGVSPVAVGEGMVTGSELYFYVDDIHAAMAQVEAAGGRILSELATRSWGDDVAYYADPDGNVIAIARPPENEAIEEEQEET